MCPAHVWESRAPNQNSDLAVADLPCLGVEPSVELGYSYN